MNATTAQKIGPHAAARTAYPAVFLQGHPLTVLHMDESSLTASTTLRLLPGRRAAIRVDTATKAMLIDSSTVLALAKDTVTYAVRLVSEVPLGCSVS